MNLWIKKIKRRRVFLSVVLVNITSYVFLLVLKVTTKNVWPGAFNNLRIMLCYLPLNIYFCVQIYFIHQMMFDNENISTLALAQSMQIDIVFEFWRKLYLDLSKVHVEDIRIPGSSFGSF